MMGLRDAERDAYPLSDFPCRDFRSLVDVGEVTLALAVRGCRDGSVVSSLTGWPLRTTGRRATGERGEDLSSLPFS